MAQTIKHPNGTPKSISLTATELEKVLGLAEGRVEAAPKLFAPEADGTYLIDDPGKLLLWRKRAAILITGTKPSRVEEIEKAGDLDRFVSLASKCPAGVDVDMLRAYISIVLQQEQKGTKMGPEQLARSMDMQKTDADGNPAYDTDKAEKYIRLLKTIPAPNSPGEMMLQEGTGDWEGQWRHQGYADFLASS